MAQRLLMPAVDLEGRFVRLDALHTQEETARTVVREGGGHYLLTVKDHQATLRANIEKKSPLPKRIFSPEHPTATPVRTQELNQGYAETRVIRAAAVSPEAVGFPLAGQAARWLRHTHGRKDEAVALITSAPVDLLPAQLWWHCNRQAWGSESSRHQRADVSDNDDRYRRQNTNALWVWACFAASPTASSWSGVPSNAGQTR